MTKEELEKDYYANRPTEPYSDDDSPNDVENNEEQIMEFDKSRVYTALNADELKIGSKVLVSNCISTLKVQVANYKEGDTRELINICSESSLNGRFETIANIYHLAYLVSEPEEKKLKWTDLKVKDVIKRGKEQAEVIYISEKGIAGIDNCHIGIGCYSLIDDKELEQWEKVEE
jgi:hypothetical protein